ncbi:hypothetical protein LPJ56_001060 [Coemansia sp. RSA 2599]|nr:hypothetical protein LPJ56_001060 [Coemansia sp. RSA 2599]
MAIALPIARVVRKDSDAEDRPPSAGLFSFLFSSPARTELLNSKANSDTQTDDYDLNTAPADDSNGDDIGTDSDDKGNKDNTNTNNSDSTDDSDRDDDGRDSSNRDALEAAVAACETTSLVCKAGQIRVLSISQGSCSWSCQKDPYYKEPRDNKGSVIGGSVGATAGVLIVLLAVLLFTQAKKRRRQRAAYEKDTADLASELSDLPLMQNVQHQGSPHRSLSSTSVPSSSDSGSKLAMAFGVGGSRRRRPQSSAWVVPRAPHPEEAGTELTMDIIDRPPESDPTLAAFEGALPYRQEKTATAYPLLAEFSHGSNASSSHGAACTTGANGAASESSELFVSGSASPKQGRLLRKHRTPANYDHAAIIVSPEDQLLHNYTIARYSADAAIAAARESAVVATPILAAFNPFNAVPSVRSLPYDDASQPAVSRKHSDKSNKSSL